MKKPLTTLLLALLGRVLTGSVAAAQEGIPIYVQPPQFQTPAPTVPAPPAMPVPVIAPVIAPPVVAPVLVTPPAIPPATPSTPPLQPTAPLVFTPPPGTVTPGMAAPGTGVPAAPPLPSAAPATVASATAAPVSATSALSSPPSAGIASETISRDRVDVDLRAVAAQPPEKLLAWFGVGLMTSNKGISAGVSSPLIQQPGLKINLRGLGEYGFKPGANVVVPVLAARADLLGEWAFPVLGRSATLYAGPGLGLQSDQTRLLGLTLGLRLPFHQSPLGAFIEAGANRVTHFQQAQTELNLRGGILLRF